MKLPTQKGLLEVLVEEIESLMDETSTEIGEFSKTEWSLIWSKVQHRLNEEYKWLPYDVARLSHSIDKFLDLWDIAFEEEDEGPCELISAEIIRKKHSRIIEIELEKACKIISKALEDIRPGEGYTFNLNDLLKTHYKTDEYISFFKERLKQILELKGYYTYYESKLESYKGFSGKGEYLIVEVPYAK